MLCVLKLISFWRQGGRARHGVHGAAKSVHPAMAIRGLQFRGPEAALEQSCGRFKLEKACAIATVALAVLACGMMRQRLKKTIRHMHRRTDLTCTPLFLSAPQALFK